MKSRQWVALTVLAGLTFAVAAGAIQLRDQFQGPNPNFWIVNKTGNQGLTDTIQGPETFIYGARQVTALIRANLGVCSLATFEVSNNDTNWEAARPTTTTQISNLTHTDSLNQGGRIVRMFSSDSIRAGGVTSMLDWKWARVVLRRKADSVQGGDATLPGRIDSLRISYATEFP